MNTTSAFSFPTLTSFSFHHPVPTSAPTSAQLLPNHTTSGLQFPTDVEQNARGNMPPSQSATILNGSKRKADFNENIPGPSLKKSRTVPVNQAPSQTLAIKPQESRAGPEFARYIPNQQPRSGFKKAFIPAEIPPELGTIQIELRGLVSFLVPSSVQLPSCGHLLTTIILRGDVPRIAFYPYLWFYGRAPYTLKWEDYFNILPESHVGAMQKTLRNLGLVCGTIGLTASRQCVLFFKREERILVQDALMKKMGAAYNDARWQGAMEYLGQNHVVAFVGHHGQQRPGPNSPSSNVGQSDHPAEQLPQSGPSSQYLPNNLTTTHQTQNYDPFILVSHDTAKRRRNGPLLGISKAPDAPQGVSGPSNYPSTTVFAETHTKESFPHPQNTNAAAAPKRRNRRRALAKSGEKGQSTTTAAQQSQLDLEGEVAQESKAQRRKRRSKKAQDPEPSQTQAGSSGSKELQTPDREVEPLYSVSVSSTMPQENTQASGSYTQHQIGYAGDVEGFAPSNNVVASQSLTTKQVSLAPTPTAIPQYSVPMPQASVLHGTNQFGLTDALGGGYYASIDLANQTSPVTYPNNFYQPSAHDMAQFSLPGPYASDQTWYGDPTAATVSNTVNPATFPTFVTGYEAGDASTNQTSVSQPSDQVANFDHDDLNMAGTLTGEHAEAPYPNVPVYEQFGQELFNPNFSAFESGRNQLQPNCAVGFDANGGSNLSNLTDQGYKQVMTPTPEQNLTYDGCPQSFYMQPQGFAPSFSGPSAGGFPGDSQAWNFNVNV